MVGSREDVVKAVGRRDTIGGRAQDCSGGLQGSVADMLEHCGGLTKCLWKVVEIFCRGDSVADGLWGSLRDD